MSSPFKIALVTALAALSLNAAPAAAQPNPEQWSGAWTAAMMRPSGSPWFETWAQKGFDDQSVRQVIRLNAGGSKLRIRLSNAYGKTPLRLTGASVGRTGKGAAVAPGTLRTLRFDRSTAVTIPAGGKVVSDPVRLPTRPRDQLSVTLYFAGATGPATYHQISMTTTYRADGDHRRDSRASAFTDRIEPGLGSWYYLEGVEVTGDRSGRDGIVTIGESTTDGFGATPNGDDSYPHALAERLIAAGRARPVLNAGIGGNKLLADSACSGDATLSRFERDALDQPGAGAVIVSIGLNDILRRGDHICGVERDDPPVTLQRLLDGYRALIRGAHARGVKVVGATLTPFQGDAAPDEDTERAESLRQAVNSWIRTSGEYDAVADFDRAVADPADPTRMRREFMHRFSDTVYDPVHPNPAGYRAMADAVDLDSL
ncbi:SGNH/GDSL hydrolase family protein [Streptosporangium sp. CA-135522]|uniref:SGNH/GDSL hydrolase family protein n=1 Tax=Streptosporangium sp. CA-135522 TaxID=3240072 RepID=UPI003D8B8393